MQTIAIELTDPREPDRPTLEDWIPEPELENTCRLASAAGFLVRVLGPVSWQRQLAHIESNPES
jgi:MOSC domain-containing protein YiiM